MRACTRCPLPDGGGWYLLAAVIGDLTEAERFRETLRSLLLRRQPRLHWHAEDEVRRAKLVGAVAGLGLTGVVVVGAPLTKSKQERARRICTERLLPELAARGVRQVWLESRTEKLNQQDGRHAVTMRGKHSIAASLRVDVALPSREPMLWAADIVAGAIGAGRVRGAPYLDAMQHRVTTIDIELR